MQQHIFKALVVLAVALPLCHAETSGELCAIGSADVGGNWFCQPVEKITYTNIDQSGTYLRTTGMDATTGACMRESVSYSGPGAPLDEEVSIHFRGPLRLSQFAAYTLGNNVQPIRKARNDPSRHAKRGHPHVYGHEMDSLAERAVGDMVTAVIDGKTVSWVNVYDGGPATPVAEAPPVDIFPTAYFQDTPGPVPTEVHEPVSTNGGSWSRIAYYNSANPTEAIGVAFLNNKGDPPLSGTFDQPFGHSASYASEDGKTAAKMSTPFRGSLDTSNEEIFIMTDISCKENDCGFYRPGSAAHHGFSGPSRAFLIEFSMPHSAILDPSALPDAPAIWMLNAEIPRVGQYASDNVTKQSCSCWTSGCGEFDIFEVVIPGDERCKSAFHRQGNAQGVDSNYFVRPTDRLIKIAVIMYEGNFTISVLEDTFQFEESWGASNAEEMLDTIGKFGKGSIFAIGP